MANKRINQLTAIDAVDDDDQAHIWDESGSASRKATMEEVFTGRTITDYAEAVATDADSGAVHTIDLENGNVHDVTLTANCTFTFSNPPASGKGGSFTLILRQDGTGSRTVTWPSSVKWASGSAPTLSTGANEVDIIEFMTVSGGATWFAFVAGQEVS